MVILMIPKTEVFNGLVNRSFADTGEKVKEGLVIRDDFARL